VPAMPGLGDSQKISGGLSTEPNAVVNHGSLEEKMTECHNCRVFKKNFENNVKGKK
jgi:hypothetical protein